MHLLREPLHLASCVTEDDRLRDGQRLVQITQRVQLPLLTHQSFYFLRVLVYTAQ